MKTVWKTPLLSRRVSVLGHAKAPCQKDMAVVVLRHGFIRPATRRDRDSGGCMIGVVVEDVKQGQETWVVMEGPVNVLIAT